MSSFALPSAAFSPAQIARRVALPLLIFAAVLTALLLLSWSLVLPRYTAFAVDGKQLAASALPVSSPPYQASPSMNVALPPLRECATSS